MAKDSKISWCHHTVNWWTGCGKVSAECKNCYAEAMVRRMGRSFGDRKMRVAAATKEALQYNLEAGQAGEKAIVFTNSLADFFDPAGDDVRAGIWETIRQTKNLYWMILTKRPQLILDRLPADWGEQGWENVWLGTTCGSVSRYKCEHTGASMTPVDRVDILRTIPARVRFISAEPLLADISDIDLTGIHWIAAGGESGPEWNYADRKMNMEHAARLYERCDRDGIRFLYKQASHLYTERGINALNLYLADGDGSRIDPKTCELIRQYPALADGKLMPFTPPGPHARFTGSEWRDYKAQATVSRSGLVVLP